MDNMSNSNHRRQQKQEAIGFPIPRLVRTMLIVTTAATCLGTTTTIATKTPTTISSSSMSNNIQSRTTSLLRIPPEHNEDDSKRHNHQNNNHHDSHHAAADVDNNVDDSRTLIVNGENAVPSQYPFFVRSAHDNVGFTYDLVCGASLIHTDMILTAAHCQGAFNYGAQIYSPSRGTFTRLRMTDAQRVYPLYHTNKELINYDVMVIRLNDAITDIVPVGLNDDPSVPSTSDRTDATGFGVTDYQAAVASNGRDGGIPNVLQVGYFRPLTPNQCSGRGRFSNVRIQDDVMCVDPWDDDSICSGDSGGPLTMPYNPTTVEQLNGNSNGGSFGGSSGSVPQAIQVGVSSFGTDCQDDHVPDGFARVSFFHDWIKEQICLMSRYPPADCPVAADDNDENSIDIQLRFRHDFSAQDTTFAVRNLVTNTIEMSGPEYIPRRGEEVVTNFKLQPGRYTFEVYDSTGDGLRNPDFVQNGYPNGSWQMTAIYSNGAQIRLGEGDENFETEQITTIVVDPLQSDFTANPTAFPTMPPSSSPTPNPTVQPAMQGAGNADDESLSEPSDSGSESMTQPNDEEVWSSGPFTPNTESSDASKVVPWLYTSLSSFVCAITLLISYLELS